MPESVVGKLSSRLFWSSCSSEQHMERVSARRLMLIAAHREGFSDLDYSSTAAFIFGYFSRLGWTPERIDVISFRDAVALIERDGWQRQDGYQLEVFELESEVDQLASALLQRLGVDSLTREGIEASRRLTQGCRPLIGDDVADRLIALLDRALVGFEPPSGLGDYSARVEALKSHYEPLADGLRNACESFSRSPGRKIGRNEWLFERATKGIAWKLIHAEFQKTKSEHDWEDLGDGNAVRIAVTRYAKSNGLSLPPRKRGRAKSDQ